MRYSKGFKVSVLKKVLPPDEQSVKKVSEETGVSAATIYLWLKRLQHGKLETEESEVRPGDRSPKEKLRLLLEGKSLPEERRGAWLRENGLHTEHLNLYEQDLRDIVSEKNEKFREEARRLRKEKQALEKELRRKDKALAEMAALLTLKKKADAIWGGDEDD